jgi:two-component system, cell cycle response regulator
MARGNQEGDLPSSKSWETETAPRPIPPTWVHGETIEAILNAGKRRTRADLLFTATRELTNLLGERGFCILLDDRPRIVVALSDPASAGRPVEVGKHPEVAEAIRARDLVVTEDGALIAVPLVADGECRGVIVIESDSPRTITDEARATAALGARVTAALLAGAPDPQGAARAGAVPRRSTPIAIPAFGPSGYGRRILVVEDDGSIAGALAQLLEDEGYVVQHARDGRDGVAWALSTRPDLILLDVNLPSLDGFAGATQLRQSPTTADVPIIFLSARRDLSAGVRLLHLDHVDFMAKPFSGDELLTRIDQALIAAGARLTLAHRAAVDELTGLANLRMFRARLADEHNRFARYGSPLSLVMIDVDKLKSINDEHGHAAGSDALCAIADVLRRQARITDLAARYGGDEMVVLLPQTGLAEASVFAERLRSAVASLDVRGARLTVSIGVASLSRTGSVETGPAVLERADNAAYTAKRGGGDRICIAAE